MDGNCWFVDAKIALRRWKLLHGCKVALRGW
jgi:hypothetical protein